MRFSDWMPEAFVDTVTLIKQDGRTFENILAGVQSKAILIGDISLPIEEGDLIARTLSNGLIERFTVTDRGYKESVLGFPSHYSVQYKRESSISAEKAASQSITYNLHGTHSRVNIGSQDQSTNISYAQTVSAFADLRQVIENQIADAGERSAILAKVDELESTAKTSAFIPKYQEFVALAANHMSIVSPFIPFLTALFGG